MALDSIKGYVIGVILGIAVILGGVFMIGSFITGDPSIDTSSEVQNFTSTLNKSYEVTTAVNQMDSELTAPEDTGALGWINVLFSSAFNGLKAIGSSMGFVTVAAEDSARMFGMGSLIPIISVVMLVVTVIILIGIYEAITRQ